MVSVDSFIKKVEKLPKGKRSREPVYDDVVKSLSKKEAGIYEITLPDKKPKSVYSALRTRLDLKKMRIIMRAGKVYIEVL